MKRLIYLIVFGLVITACGNRSNTLTSKDNEFKIKDTASIDKIFLAKKYLDLMRKKLADKNV